MTCISNTPPTYRLDLPTFHGKAALQNGGAIDEEPFLVEDGPYFMDGWMDGWMVFAVMNIKGNPRRMEFHYFYLCLPTFLHVYLPTYL